MLSKKQLEALKKDAKRRARRPANSNPISAPLKITDAAEDRIIEEQQPLLFAIESTLIDAWRSKAEIDDGAVAEALIGALRRFYPQDPQPLFLRRILEALRVTCPAEDKAWNGALQVVLKSVRRHSSCRPGDRSYLLFADKYIPASAPPPADDGLFSKLLSEEILTLIDRIDDTVAPRLAMARDALPPAGKANDQSTSRENEGEPGDDSRRPG